MSSSMPIPNMTATSGARSDGYQTVNAGGGALWWQQAQKKELITAENAIVLGALLGVVIWALKGRK